MVIYLGSDHRGFALKESVKEYLKQNGYEVVDLGALALDENDDYPDYAAAVAARVSSDAYGASRGIVICGSGIGVCVVANKYPNVRAGLVTSSDQAYLAKNDDDINVLCLASDFTEDMTAKMIVASWLQTAFSGDERHKRRLRKIQEIEILLKESR